MDETPLSHEELDTPEMRKKIAVAKARVAQTREDEVRTGCLHESVTLYSYEVNQMALSVYSVVCEECGAFLTAEGPELALRLWSSPGSDS